MRVEGAACRAAPTKHFHSSSVQIIRVRTTSCNVPSAAAVAMLAGSPREAGTLRLIIAAAKRELRCNLPDLTVLSANNDPYRLDTPAGHRNALWFKEQVGALVLPNVPIHLRGLHYRCVSAKVGKLDGLPYENSEDDWHYLVNVAAKAARWLGV